MDQAPMNQKINLRKWGESPFKVAVLHGGPGAPGEVAPVAKELSKDMGVLELFQTKDSISAQVLELRDQIMKNAEYPIVIIGWSWGSWLGYIFSSMFPNLVSKLILVSSGTFDKQYLEEFRNTRLSRLTKEERERVLEIESLLNNPNNSVDDKTFQEFGALYSKADKYSEIENIDEGIEEIQFPDQSKIYTNVWAEASKLRETGELLRYGKGISCPVISIQGEYDANSIEKSLSQIIRNHKHYELKKCGHHPWREKFAREEFYKILREEIR